MAFHVIIPARYASTRLPGKPLRPLMGKPMIQHVYERALEAGAVSITVATDDRRIAEACQGFGAQYCITSAEHQSGTDRLAEVVDRHGFDDDAVVVNVQGDEPLMPPACIVQVAQLLAHKHGAAVATLAYRLASNTEIFDPNRVKLVMDKDQRVLYFSRAPIPWDRDGFTGDPDSSRPSPAATYLGHIGLYAYRAGYLRQYSDLAPSPLERIEALEQLRVLWHGGRIYAEIACEPVHHGVDSDADMQAVERELRKRAIRD